MNSKAQITLFEMAFVLLLFFGFLTFFASASAQDKASTDHQFIIEGFADILYLNDTFRNVIMREDLANDRALTENWTVIETLLNDSFSDYEIIIRDSPSGSAQKYIYSCNKTFGKVVTQRVFSGNDTQTNSYDFRRLTLGVCY